MSDSFIIQKGIEQALTETAYNESYKSLNVLPQDAELLYKHMGIL